MQDDIFDGLAVKVGSSEQIGCVPGEQICAISSRRGDAQDDGLGSADARPVPRAAAADEVATWQGLARESHLESAEGHAPAGNRCAG
jgi:hypothetical protein